MYASQIVLCKISETSKRLGRCFYSLQSKIHKVTLANCLKDLRELTNSLFLSNGSNFIYILDELDTMEHIVIALEKHAKIPLINEDISLDSYDLIKELISSTTSKEMKQLLYNLYLVIMETKECELSYTIQYTLWLEKQQISQQLNKSTDQFT